MWAGIPDYLLDALIDSAKMLPVLYIIYLLMEFIEHKAGKNFPKLLGKTSAIGPLAGSFVGAFPQCGLAAASASLYSGRIITLGTLLAVFLSSSDEMLPIFISSAVPFVRILKIVGLKIAIAIVSGYLVDIILKSRQKIDAEARREAEDAFAGFEHRSNIFVCALRRTLEIFIYVFIFSFILNLLIGLVGEERLAAFMNSVPVLGEVVAGLVGLIPNCASSVVITELFLDGIIGTGPMLTGLLVNAGIGTMVLIKTNRNVKENIVIVCVLYGIGLVWGVAAELIGLVL
jgi:hypothetical protein